MTISTFKTYTYLASALINGDTSGLDSEDDQVIDDIIAAGYGDVFDYSEESDEFAEPDFGERGGLVSTYTAYIHD